MKKTILTMLLVAAVAIGGAFGLSDTASAATVSATGTGVKCPTHLYYGKGFIVRGSLHAPTKLETVRVGVMTTKNKWKFGYYATRHPKTRSYNLSNVDAYVPIKKLRPGTYYYAVTAKAAGGKTKFIKKRKFTVSYLSTSGLTKPTEVIKGRGFVLKGYAKSTYKMSYLKVGVKNSKGQWKSGYFKTKRPNSTSYDVNKVDADIKFGSLSTGTYYYCLYAEDACGIRKTVVSKKFKVVKSTSGSSGDSGSVSSRGKILSYNNYVIGSVIGAQPVSGPCGIYAMAYCRTVLDGTFTKGKYSTVYSRLINQYGHGSFCAYWWEAGGSSSYYTTASSAYRTALSQVSKGRPCIINVRNGYTGNQHYVTVVGYTAGTTMENVNLNRFIVLDPAYGTLKYLNQMPYYNNSSPQCITF